MATELLANKNEVSFETMRKAGATTLWENWNAESSHSHPMFGASTVYLFRDILGIRQTEESVAYNKIVIEPVFAECLDFARGYVTTPKGRVFVGWKRNDGKVSVEVNVPDGIVASFRCGETIKELKAGSEIFDI